MGMKSILRVKMLTSRTYYIWNPGDRKNFIPEVYYYNQPVKDVLIYHVMNIWYHILDIEFLRKRICKRAKSLAVLPRDCGLEHDHINEPETCWFICPCVYRDLNIHNYRDKNAVEI